MKPQVLVIMGFTASGKSALAIDLAQKFNGEIISADSVAIYRGMDIGSAKPTLNELCLVKHHLIDCLDICQSYDVSQFVSEAKKLIVDICSRGKLPIIVGGTGLYIRALLYDYQFVDEEKLDDDYDNYSNEQLMDLLKTLDYERSQKIHINNRVRLLRGVRALVQGGLTYADIDQFQSKEMVFDTKLYFLSGDRQMIYERINQRVDEMMARGLLNEVSNLSLKGKLLASYRSLNAIGYREFAGYFNQEMTLEQVVELIKKNSRNFAKRQLTWFKNQMQGEMIDCLDVTRIEKEVAVWRKL